MRYPELGYYALPGHVSDSRGIAEDVLKGHELGFGSVWISERLNTKNVEVLSGCAATLTEEMGIAAGLMSNVPLRSPLVTAAYGATMALMTGDRFALGLGRGVDRLADASGTPRLTFRLLEEYVGLVRRLWDGETIHHDGPFGRFRGLTLGADLLARPPVIMAAMGDRTCLWAGRIADAVVFNSLWSARAVEHSVKLVRRGAEEAGRDPASVRTWTILMTACEAPEEVYLQEVIRRISTYLMFPGMFDDICRANGWDPARAAEVRDRLNALDGARKAGLVGDENLARETGIVRRAADWIPPQWVDEGCSVGDAAHCARKMRERLDAGIDGILIHSSRARHLGPLMEAWPGERPARCRDDAPLNPGYAA